MDSFYRIVNLPHPFGTYEDRTVLAFCKTPEQVEEAKEAGADLAGGTELIQRIQVGALSSFYFSVNYLHNLSIFTQFIRPPDEPRALHC